MNDSEIIASIKSLEKGSKISVTMIFLGVLFLASSIIYSFSSLQPLKREVEEFQSQIQQLEAKKAALEGFAVAAEIGAKPTSINQKEVVGWVYIGLKSGSGDWISKSERIDTSAQPSTLKNGSEISTKLNASLIENPKNIGRIDATPPAGNIISLFIKPNTKLTVIDTIEQQTIGSANLIWAKVRANNSDLLEVR